MAVLGLLRAVCEFLGLIRLWGPFRFLRKGQVLGPQSVRPEWFLHPTRNQGCFGFRGVVPSALSKG